MWGQKFGFIVENALTFPLNHFSKIRSIFINTTLVMCLAVLVLSVFTEGSIMIFFGQNQLTQSLGITINMGVSVAVMFGIVVFAIHAVLVPLFVAIIRAITNDETASPSPLVLIQQKRQYLTLWSFVLLLLMFFLIAALEIAYSFGLYKTLSNGLVTSEFFTKVLFFLNSAITLATFGALLIFLPRWIFVPVNAALDQGSSLKASSDLASGNWWLIVPSFFAIVMVVRVGTWLAYFISEILLTPIMYVAGPMIAIPVGAVLYMFIYVCSLVPGFALFGYLYLVLSGQVAFGSVQLNRPVTG